MAISKRLRYEVLRRDEHTCQYCGESAPDVTLHIDHVVPVALGGTDDPGNLVTACKDCNAGKTSIPADAPLVKKVSDHAAAYALSLTDKMTRIRGRIQESTEYIEQFKDEWDHWHDTRTKEKLPLPPDWKETLRRWSDMGVPLDLVEHAIEVGMTKPNLREEYGQFRYMCGVIWRTLDKEDTPYELTTETVATYTASETEEMASERGAAGYQAGFARGYDAALERAASDLEGRIINGP